MAVVGAAVGAAVGVAGGAVGAAVVGTAVVGAAACAVIGAAAGGAAWPESVKLNDAPARAETATHTLRHPARGLLSKGITGIICTHVAMEPGRMLMTKRLLPITAVLMLALSACSALAPKFNRPNISVARIELRGGNLLQQNFAVKLNIQNPNDRTLPIAGVHVELHVGGEQIASGVSDRAIVVPANGESDFDMTIKANVALALLKLANKLDQHSDSIDYDLTGSASIDLPFLRDLPFHQTGSLSLKGM
jgi:LEA14-like dessication related protein